MFVEVMSVICKSKVVCEVWFNIFVTYITDSEFRLALFVDVGVELARKWSRPSQQITYL